MEERKNRIVSVGERNWEINEKWIEGWISMVENIREFADEECERKWEFKEKFSRIEGWKWESEFSIKNLIKLRKSKKF